MPIAELDKPANSPCKNLCEKGCGTYETRPSSCRDYGCLWLHGFGRTIERPDRVGYFLNNNEHRTALVAYEARPGAFGERLVQDSLTKLARRHPVLLAR
jgi:Fe-S-cluster containining protein